MNDAKLICLIGEAECGRLSSQSICGKCGLDDRVVYPSEHDRNTAQRDARSRYSRTMDGVV